MSETTSLVREWEGKTIRQREDGYLSATDMCQACRKRLNDWYRLSSTSEYLKALETSLNIPVTGNPATAQPQGFQALVEVNQGGTPEEQGTWVHHRVAIRLAQWLSPEFAVQVDQWVEEVLLGKRPLQSSFDDPSLPENYLEALKQLVASEEARQLAEARTELIASQLDDAESTLDSYRAVLSPECCLDVTQVAKALGVKNLGRNKLFDYLRSKDFIQQKPSTIPYQHRIDEEQAVVETVSVFINGEDVAKQKAKITFRGLEYIVKSLKKDGYNVTTTARAIWDYYNANQLN